MTAVCAGGFCVLCRLPLNQFGVCDAPRRWRRPSIACRPPLLTDCLYACMCSLADDLNVGTYTASMFAWPIRVSSNTVLRARAYLSRPRPICHGVRLFVIRRVDREALLLAVGLCLRAAIWRPERTNIWFGGGDQCAASSLRRVSIVFVVILARFHLPAKLAVRCRCDMN